ncbi:MAG: hypothetical protein K0S71_2477 [Clostridia bacterium]|nr:hypothetical protein [Clostridia bacterium]
MNHYKTCVYGVCKNEEKFAKRCMESLSDADVVVMGDTGSTDNTIDVLRNCGAIVHSIPVNPWRFDVARNACLNLIPEDVDICVCIDLDEVLAPGWREALEKAWTSNTHRASYLYIWSFNQDGSPAVQYYHERIHARHNYTWIYPTHEVLKYLGEGKENWVFADGLVFKHYPDDTKSRSFNLELLELAVEENPDSPRNMHYLGREYYFAGYYDNAIKTLTKYLALPNANWREERSFAMRYIANSYTAQGNILEAKSWLLKAICEAPRMREAYVEMARLAYRLQDFNLVYFMTNLALQIKERSPRHYNEGFAWNETIYDLAALGAYYTGFYKESLVYAKEALKIAPNDERLISNLKFIQEKCNKVSYL